MKYLLVKDTSTTEEHRVRSHDIFIDGELLSVGFEYGKYTRLPENVALKFVQTGFIVVSEADNTEILQPATADANILSRLNDGEVIAKYEELTLEALITRAAICNGGEIFIDTTDRNAVIYFLKNGAVVDTVEPEQTIDDEDTLIDDVAEEIAVEELPEAVEQEEVIEAVEAEEAIVEDVIEEIAPETPAEEVVAEIEEDKGE